VLYRDFLVSLAAMAIQSLEQGCVGAGQLVGLIEALLFAFPETARRALGIGHSASRAIDMASRFGSSLRNGG
jgi:hypothetical protein